MNWHALRCATRQEEAAQAHLDALGYETFLPVEVRWRRTRSTKVRARRPLFLGYLFVRCVTDDIFAAQRAEGVHRFVGWRDTAGEHQPLVIPEEAIAEIRAEQPQHDHTAKEQPSYRPSTGDQVRIKRGLWSGRLAQVLESPAGRRAALMIDGAFGGRVSLDASALEPVHAANRPANLKSSTKAA